MFNNPHKGHPDPEAALLWLFQHNNLGICNQFPGLVGSQTAWDSHSDKNIRNEADRVQKTKTFHSNQQSYPCTQSPWNQFQPHAMVLFTPHNCLDVEHHNELKIQGQTLLGGGGGRVCIWRQVGLYMSHAVVSTFSFCVRRGSPHLITHNYVERSVSDSLSMMASKAVSLSNRSLRNEKRKESQSVRELSLGPGFTNTTKIICI